MPQDENSYTVTAEFASDSGTCSETSLVSAVDRALLEACDRLRAIDKEMNDHFACTYDLADELRLRPKLDVLCEREKAAHAEVWAILGKYPEDQPLSPRAMVALAQLVAANKPDESFGTFEESIGRITVNDIAEFGAVGA